MKGPAFVRYFPGDMLDGVQFLSPWEELAYRRICDLIYKTGDHLEGDDRKLAKMTKTGRRWRKIKAALIADEKLFIADDGRISNRRCQEELVKTVTFLRQKSDSGHNSAVAGKSLKNLNRGPNGSRTNSRTTFLSTYIEDSSLYLGKGESGDLLPAAPWEQRCRAWIESGFWQNTWGPPPSEAGCYAPAELVAEVRHLRNGGDPFDAGEESEPER